MVSEPLLNLRSLIRTDAIASAELNLNHLLHLGPDPAPPIPAGFRATAPPSWLSGRISRFS